ncbi:endonuclease/exonuclease/phosphatase family protein [Antarcticibacterium flavum]|uniref:Endonuclease/exonuclease/phosphatase family protein n=1 Tax=Antarcticibacterium flavum TaxID=2058175 RepID=A0A5B7WXR5_9FLAO|nr:MULTISPECIES: endonuclease/exonuclease/phosphatase family protein [Antarcticibacterium]MCM4161837.1 endonuclease/exonuclease/phosphatase family protein [Antarcticibacterium sp. W02-3]QCY67954.1 endonuclease/exonuclease/phosphatase family protein [Antarcticibacterium flavum]
MKLKSFLQSVGLVAIILTLLPFIAADFWWIRIFDFPHTQLTVLTFVALVTYFYKFDMKWVQDYVFVAVLTGCFLFQLTKIWPYIPHGNYELMEADATQDRPQVKFYIANVLQDNENPDKLIKDLTDKDPDLILLMETNTRWMQDVRPALEDYPHRVEVPLDNTYGMLLYSRLPLVDPEVKYLVDDSIPSIHTRFSLPAGEEIRLYCIHPTPPMPQHTPSSTDRDAEMMLVAKSAKNSEMPVIVTGDFNDVAWSQTTRLFKDVSGLLDPRIGRGFYNTFNAKNPVMRWPLDHFFASDDFRLVNIGLGADIDSDHFPAVFVVSLEPEKAREQKREEPSEKQKEQATESIQDAREDKEEEKKKEAEEKQDG